MLGMSFVHLEMKQGKVKAQTSSSLEYSLPSTSLGAAAKSLPQGSPHPEKWLQELCKCSSNVLLFPSPLFLTACFAFPFLKAQFLHWHLEKEIRALPNQIPAAQFGMEGAQELGRCSPSQTGCSGMSFKVGMGTEQESLLCLTLLPNHQGSFPFSAAAPHGNEEPQEPTLPAQPVLLCSSVAHVKMGVEKLLQDFCSTITSQEFPSCQQSGSKAWESWHLQGWRRMAGKSLHLSPRWGVRVSLAAPPFIGPGFSKSHFPRMTPGAGVWDLLLLLCSSLPAPQLPHWGTKLSFSSPGLALFKATAEPWVFFSRSNNPWIYWKASSLDEPDAKAVPMQQNWPGRV